MSAEYSVIGHYKYVDDVVSTIRQIRSLGINDIEVFSPLPNHDIEDELYLHKPRSPVRFFTLLGATTGCLGAFFMTTWMSTDWPLRVSAKPIVSYPSFVVIAFECTILLGGLFTLFSMLGFNRLPNFFRKTTFRESFTGDTFGLTVRVQKEQAEAIEKELKALGAHLVEVQYVR